MEGNSRVRPPGGAGLRGSDGGDLEGIKSCPATTPAREARRQLRDEAEEREGGASAVMTFRLARGRPANRARENLLAQAGTCARRYYTTNRQFSWGVRVSMLRPRFRWSSISAAAPIMRP